MTKRVLIISEHRDQTTNEVIAWIKFLGHKFVRINETDKIFLEKVNHKTLTFKLNGELYCLSDFTAFWYRRGFFPIINEYSEYIDNSDLNLAKFTNSYIKSEINQLALYIDFFFKNTFKVIVETPETSEENKLVVLYEAVKCGLNVPDYLVTTSKKELIKFFKYHKGKVISKPIHRCFTFSDETKFITSYTIQVSKNDIENLDNHFAPTFFQERISKKVEIRTFYLNGRTWSMVIDSQKSPKTSVDFRNYVKSKPNRNYPYIIDKEIHDKIDKLMKNLDLKSGSIDLIHAVDNSIYFLEVNPIGQFGMTSKPCNYNLEKEMATYLIS